MKNLITLSAFFATFLTFGQTEKLVHYKIEANEHVKSFSAVARKHSKTNGQNHGNVESINGTTINLLLATDTDYKFMINNNIIEIKGNDVAAYALDKEEQQMANAGNTTDRVFASQLGAFQYNRPTNFVSKISSSKPE